MSASSDGGNGHDLSIELPAELPVVPYPQILNVPPGSTALVVPIDGLRLFVQTLSREWLGTNSGFFSLLVDHVGKLPE